MIVAVASLCAIGQASTGGVPAHADTPVAISAADQDAILKMHNDARREVGVTTALVWDDGLAADALTWAKFMASKNAFRHGNPDEADGNQAKKEGENISYGWGPAPGQWEGGEDVSSLTKFWYDEKADWEALKSPVIQPKKLGAAMIGHYTQMIWSRTTKIGCGLVMKPTHELYYSCRYSPPGNYLGQSPTQPPLKTDSSAKTVTQQIPTSGEAGATIKDGGTISTSATAVSTGASTAATPSSSGTPGSGAAPTAPGSSATPSGSTTASAQTSTSAPPSTSATAPTACADADTSVTDLSDAAATEAMRCLIDKGRAEAKQPAASASATMDRLAATALAGGAPTIDSTFCNPKKNRPIGYLKTGPGPSARTPMAAYTKLKSYPKNVFGDPTATYLGVASSGDAFGVIGLECK